MNLKQGIYEQIIYQDLKEQIQKIDPAKFQLEKEKLDVEEAKNMLSGYISSVIKKGLRFIRESNNENDKEALLFQIRACNEMIRTLSKLAGEESLQGLKIADEGEVLTSLYSKINTIRSINAKSAVRPVTPLSQSTLFTNSPLEPNMVNELKKEIICSDRIDMLVSFIKWSGLVCIIEELKEFTQDDNHKLRIITTSYMGATDYKAIKVLSELKNTEIKISYDTKRTRLHAKAYMFKRDTGFTTAYIGSSNLSNAALTAGLEWNLKVTEKDSLSVIQKIEATFENYWNDNEFTTFNGDAEEDRDRLKKSLNKEASAGSENDVVFALDVQPYYYQKEILEKLQAERKLYGRYKNLLVAATGERVIIVIGCINALVSRVSETFIKNLHLIFL